MISLIMPIYPIITGKISINCIGIAAVLSDATTIIIMDNMSRWSTLWDNNMYMKAYFYFKQNLLVIC